MMYKGTGQAAGPYSWEQGMPDQSARPTNLFVPFEKQDVEQSIPQRFEEQAVIHPHRLAIKADDGEFTYAALNQAANRVAWAILDRRGERAETVALILEQGALSIAALLGVLKAGKTYVPLDPSYPRARISYMLQDSQAELIVTDSKHLVLAGELAEASCSVMNVTELDADLPSGNPGLQIPPGAYAYILYTSGSTGQAKGVIENHRNVLHFSMVIGNGFHIGPGDRCSLLSSLCFSASASDIFPALLNGAVIMPYDVKKKGLDSLADWLIQEGITRYESVPTLFRRLCDTLTSDHKFPQLRIVGVGGDRVEQGDVDLYRKHFATDCIFHIGLGATEVKIISRYFVNKHSQLKGGVLPVGYAVDDVDILLLDEVGNRVGPDQVGEIAVRSRYVSPGYWRRPELAQARFLPDPHDDRVHVYLTGDIGRIAPDGCLTHLGRKDFQVKIRGYRVEIAEIEAVLRGMDAVKEAVVVAREGHNGDQQLVAYLVPVTKPAPRTTNLRHSLAERLPDYMIPSIFVMLEALPLNANGKVDRKALPAPSQVHLERESRFVAPRTPVENKVAEIWAQVLDLEQVGVLDNFVELGGHSLLAIQIITRLRAAYDIELSLSSVVEAPSVESLAELVESLRYVQKRAPAHLEAAQDYEEFEV
jgi:amino acid adenylation domain-containing protein